MTDEPIEEPEVEEPVVEEEEPVDPRKAARKRHRLAVRNRMRRAQRKTKTTKASKKRNRKK